LGIFDGPSYPLKQRWEFLMAQAITLKRALGILDGPGHHSFRSFRSNGATSL